MGNLTTASRSFRLRLALKHARSTSRRRRDSCRLTAGPWRCERPRERLLAPAPVRRPRAGRCKGSSPSASSRMSADCCWCSGSTSGAAEWETDTLTCCSCIWNPPGRGGCRRLRGGCRRRGGGWRGARSVDCDAGSPAALQTVPFTRSNSFFQCPLWRSASLDRMRRSSD